MFDWWWLAVLLFALAFTAAVLAWRPLRRPARRIRLADARRDFHLQRERLEAKFIRLAEAQAKPDAPRWVDCEFDNDISYVRNRATGELAAFVGITVQFDGGLDDDAFDLASIDADGQLRIGTAVFRFDAGRWDTDGVTLLNLSPAEAIVFYRNDLEVVDQELAR